MHALVAVLHHKERDVNNIMDKFLYDNENYFITENIAQEELIESFEKRLAHIQSKLQEDLPEYDKKTLLAEESSLISCRTLEQIVKKECSYLGYTYNKELQCGFYESNPFGEFDYYMIGGRYAGSLVNTEGESRTSGLIKECQLDAPYTHPYGAIVDYDDGKYNDMTKERWDEIVEDALNRDDDIYITVVDVHY